MYSFKYDHIQQIYSDILHTKKLTMTICISFKVIACLIGNFYWDTVYINMKYQEMDSRS